MPTDVKIDQAAVKRMANRRNGPVVSDLERRAKRVQRKARQLAPGRMGKKITARTVKRGEKTIVVVESTHPATLFVIKGTRKHMIYPRKKGGVLAFKVNGKKVFARRVKHPGTKKNDFMTQALREAR